MNKKYEIAQQAANLKYKQKKTSIKKALEIDFENLITRATFGDGEERAFLFGSTTPLISFSRLTKGLIDYSNVPQANLEKVAILGKSFMENLELISFGAKLEELDLKEKEEKLHIILKEWLLERGMEIRAIEQCFISKCEKYYGYMDLIVYDLKKNEYAMVEIKTRGTSNRKIENMSIAQACFYKKHFHNIRTYVLYINRDFNFEKSDELKTNWKYRELEIKKGLGIQFIALILASKDVENWELYRIEKKRILE